MAVRLDRDKLLKALRIPAVGQATVIVASKTSRKAGIADYRCDGLDDQVEIQKAIDEVADLGGGTVFLMEGTYNINTTGLTEPAYGEEYALLIRSKVRLKGAGMNATKLFLVDGANANPIGGESPISDVIIEDLEIDGNRAKQTEAGRAIILRNVNRVIVRRCYIHNALRNAVEIVAWGGEQSRNVLIEGIIGINNGYGGIWLCTIENALILNNYFRDCGKNGIEIDIHEVTGIVSKNIVIANNLCIYNYDGGICLNSTSGADVRSIREIVIANNVCLDTYGGEPPGAGIGVEWYSGYPEPAFSHISIIGNVCRENIWDGIHIFHCDNVIAAGNVCNDNGEYGIDEDTAGDYNLIHGNICRGNTVGAIRVTGVNTISADNRT